MPSQVKAAQPVNGIRTSQGMNFRQASMTAGSEVIIRTMGMPPNQYTAMNPSTILMLQ